MKKSKRRNSSLKSRRRRQSQKVWRMRGCASKGGRVSTKPHHVYDSHGVCKKCGHQRHRRYTKSKRGGSPDAPLAYTGTGNVPSVPNPHFAYTGVQKGGYVNIPSPLAPLNVNAIPQQPFVAAPWGPSVSQWPGVSAPHDGNYLAKNTYNVQPEMHPVDEQATYVKSGGRRRRRNSRKLMKGGNFGIFSELGTNITNAYRGWNGEPNLPSPLPYADQMFYGRNAQDNLNYLKVG